MKREKGQARSSALSLCGVERFVASALCMKIDLALHVSGGLIRRPTASRDRVDGVVSQSVCGYDDGVGADADESLADDVLVADA